MKLTFTGSMLPAIFLLSTALMAGAQAPDRPITIYEQAGVTAGPAMPPGPGQNAVYFRSFRLEDNKVVTGLPYSAQAITETTQVLSDGNRIDRKDTAQVYRDSKGRTRRELNLSNIGPWSAAGGPMQMVSIFDPVAGVHYMLNVQKKQAFKMPARRLGGQVPQPPPPPPGAVTFIAKGGDGEFSRPTTVSLGTQEIEGVEAQGTRTTETIPAGKIGNERPIVITTERWYSPDLQLDVLVKHSDPRMGDVVYQLTNINRDEQDPSLFQVPADYTVVQNGPMLLQKTLQ